MARLEENKMVVEEMAKRSKQNPTGTYEEVVTFQLGTIATMLTDISRSLAIIADGVEKEPQESESKRYAELSKSYAQGLRDGLAGRK